MFNSHPGIKAPAPYLTDYEEEKVHFNWRNVSEKLTGQAYSDDIDINIAREAVEKHASGSVGDVVAIRWIKKDRTWTDYTYRNLDQLTSKFANVLKKLNVHEGDTVFAFTGRIPELYITALGTLKYKAVFCPLFSVFGPEAVFQRLSKGEAKVLVTTIAQFEKKIQPLLEKLSSLAFILITDSDNHISGQVLSLKKLMVEVSGDFSIPRTSPEDPALLHFTSGTTGMPKGAVHVHQAALIHYITGKYVLDFHPGDVFWCTADPGWVTGTSYGILAPLLNGITNIIDEEEFDAMRWFSILEEHKVNIWYTAPTAIRRLMRLDIRPLETWNLENLRLVCSVGEPLHAEAVEWGRKTLGLPILDNWWQTETGGIMIANYRSMKIKAGSMGKPLPGIDAGLARISGNDFELIHEPGIKGHLVLKKGWPSMFRTYLHEEERYARCFHDEWYITGDMAICDEDGYYWFAGRSDDIIKTSGHMVGPFEVEAVLMSHPSVSEAAVIGIPDPVIGEMVKAFLVLKPGLEGSTDLMLDITGYARKKLGPAIAPKEIVFTGNLPKTKSGKILRRLIKARELGLPEGDLSTLEKE